MSAISPWASSRAAADYLQISQRTLLRWRDAGLLKLGVHYRRKFPATNSPLLYQLQACEQAMTETFSRDFRTLELASSERVSQ